MKEFVQTLGPLAAGWVFGRMISIKVLSSFTKESCPIWWIDVVAALVVVLILGKWLG